MHAASFSIAEIGESRVAAFYTCLLAHLAGKAPERRHGWLWSWELSLPSLCICKRLTHYFTLHLTTKFKYTILLQTCKLFGPPWVNAHFVSCESHFISCDVRPSTCLLCERMMELHDTTISSIFIDSLLPEAPPTGDIGTTTKLTIFVLDFVWWHALSDLQWQTSGNSSRGIRY